MSEKRKIFTEETKRKISKYFYDVHHVILRKGDFMVLEIIISEYGFINDKEDETESDIDNNLWYGTGGCH